MSNSLKDQIYALVKLQRIEVEAGSIESLLKGVPEKTAALDTELKTFEESMATEGTRVDELKKQYRDQEREVQLNITRIKKSQGKLHAIKNNKEYQSLLKEIDDIRTVNSDIEDQMLANLDLVDTAEASIAEKKDAYVSLSQEIKDEKEHIQQNAHENQERLAALEKDRNQLTGTIGSDLLDKYNVIRKRRIGGLAIVPVSDSVCGGCNVGLPPQMYNELQALESLRFCPNCQRIVYWDQS